MTPESPELTDGQLAPIATGLAAWYGRHQRSLPFRQTRDAYKIWLSEIILQQTRVAQGLPYYERFVEAFPDVTALANAPEGQVLRLWQGLGYYTRARNLHKTAKIIAAQGRRFPETAEALSLLPGIGPYTAAAIASFAFGERAAVLDGNVMRVLSRLFGVHSDIRQPATAKVLRQIAQSLIAVAADPAEHNQAIMEFGALQCTPTTPACLICPLQLHCYASHHQLQQVLPYKSAKEPVKEQFWAWLWLSDTPVHTDNTHYLLGQQESGIWHGLWLPPTFKATEPFRSTDFAHQINQAFGTQQIELSQGAPFEITHLLTHRKLHIQVITGALQSNTIDFSVLEGFTWMLPRAIETVAKPKPLVTFLQTLAL